MIMKAMLRDTELPHDTLSVSPRGRVTICTCCDQIEVVFGNAVLHVDDRELWELGRAIAALRASPDDPLDERPYLLRPVEDRPIAFGFSAEELDELGGLVFRALQSHDPERAPRSPSAHWGVR